MDPIDIVDDRPVEPDWRRHVPWKPKTPRPDWHDHFSFCSHSGKAPLNIIRGLTIISTIKFGMWALK